MDDPSWGNSVFLEGHIAGAIHADIEAHLADQPNQHGRHPLPSADSWLAQVRTWGIKNKDQIVVYDDAGSSFAPRAWWMMRWLGHENVAVLDGGVNNWPGSLTPAAAGIEAAEPSDYQSHTPLTKLSSVEAVVDLSRALSNKALNGSEILLDARAETRFSGAEEPIDPVAGHIPGAICAPFGDNLDTKGFFKSPEQLARRFLELGLDPTKTAQAITAYCGSGVTAIHNILALRIAGFGEVSLYADSWSGWITDPDRPVATQFSA